MLDFGVKLGNDGAGINYPFMPLNTVRVQAFIDATAITDQDIIDALNVLDNVIIDNSFAAKFTTLHPFVGGTATTHKFNFMDARDLDAAYRLTFFGGITHGTDGATPNGTNGYADTHLAHNSLSQNDTHLSYYSRGDSLSSGTEIGEETTSRSIISLNRSANTHYALSSANSTSLGIIDKAGYFLANRDSASSDQFYKNGAELTNTTTVSATASSNNFYFFARNASNTASMFTGRTCSIATLGASLTASEVLIWSNAVQVFQTSLGRAI